MTDIPASRALHPASPGGGSRPPLSRDPVVLPPSTYPPADLAFIVPRVLELTYTSHSMAPFARDLGYEGKPSAWNEDRRAHLRAELDAHIV